MPTRLLLEGSDLAELMGQVRAEFGPAARIVRAERVRSGGLAGFFARERYELTIDVPDAPVVPVPSLRARRAALAAQNSGPALSGMDALLAAADSADGAAAVEPVPSRSGPDDAPRVSTGEAAFADLLDQMRALSGLPTPDRVVEVTADPLTAADELDVAEFGTARSVSTALDRAMGAPAWDATPDASASDVGPTASAVPTPAADASAPNATVPTPVTRAHLADLGVPPHLLTAVGPGPVQLSRLLAAVPSAPALPRDPGTVLAVVGLPEDALRVAELLVLRHASSGAVVRAGDLDAPAASRLTTPAAATRWRQHLDPQADLTVVAVGVGPGRSRESAAADLIAALAPTQLWAVADARSKPRDCSRWLGAVGAARPVDALAVTGLFDTSEPGTVLGLPVPVAWIDGVPASRMAWAAALGEHLPSGTDWS
ncbi:hypothetical protein [Cellulomonas sp. NPDC089187]|uniref:hypothetical protein n=1 Tax=Cellulomonas sp. NPDC089187 TaxID=3154970 RepID=UPI00343976E6